LNRHLLRAGAGNWNVAGSWTPAGVPNNGGGNTYNVFIDGGNIGENNWP